MSDAVVNHVTSAHDFPTSESQRVLERRTWHIVAAGLMVSEGATKKMVDLEKSVLANFIELVEADKEATASMKLAMRKAQGGALLDMKGSSIWRKYKQVKAFVINQMMPFWVFKSGDNEMDALNRVRKEVWAFLERKKKEDAIKKKIKKQKMAATAACDVNEDTAEEDEEDEWDEVDPEDCPALWFCVELLVMKQFKNDPILQWSSGSECSGGEDDDIDLVTRKVNSRRKQRLAVNEKAKDEKLVEKQMNAVIAKAAFEYKERKENRKMQALDKAAALQEEKMVFEWVKLGFESNDKTINREAQMLAVNVMQQKRKAMHHECNSD